MKITLLLLALLLAGCLGTENSTPTPTSVPPTEAPTSDPEPTATEAEPTLTAPPAEPSATPTSPTESVEISEPPYPANQAVANNSPYPAPGQEAVKIIGENDLPLAGTLFLPGDAEQPWPGVLLLHMLGSSKEAWDDVAMQLAEAGYAVLAIDMRGHGETNDDVNWSAAEADHQRALNFLSEVPGVDNTHIGIMGASIGSNMALKAGATRDSINTVILLSPGLDYAGVTTESAISTYEDRPILIVASSEDTYAATSSETLASQAQGEAKLVMLDGAGHGTNMFPREPGLIDTIIEWLDQHLS